MSGRQLAVKRSAGVALEVPPNVTEALHRTETLKPRGDIQKWGISGPIAEHVSEFFFLKKERITRDFH